MSRPWTESAEKPASSSHDDMHRYIAETRQQRKARQALNALAPEMAEVILGIADTLKDYGPDYEQKPICVLADKLRAIGGDNE